MHDKIDTHFVYLCEKDGCKENGDRIKIFPESTSSRNEIIRCYEHRPDNKERQEIMELICFGDLPAYWKNKCKDFSKIE